MSGATRVRARSAPRSLPTRTDSMSVEMMVGSTRYSMSPLLSGSSRSSLRAPMSWLCMMSRASSSKERWPSR